MSLLERDVLYITTYLNILKYYIKINIKLSINLFLGFEHYFERRMADKFTGGGRSFHSAVFYVDSIPLAWFSESVRPLSLFSYYYCKKYYFAY